MRKTDRIKVKKKEKRAKKYNPNKAKREEAFILIEDSPDNEAIPDSLIDSYRGKRRIGNTIFSVYSV